jgi:predicted Zn-dependent protease
MKMSEGLREEILSTVVRAQIRLRQYPDATSTIEDMKKRRYRQVAFLEGHLLRKRRKFEEAIPKLRLALEHNRGNRAAVHELALCYRRLHRSRELETLLHENEHVIDDSAQFLDFMIGLRIARNELGPVPAAIERLRQLDDSSTRADLRQAQLLSRQNNDKGAYAYLTDILGHGGGSMRLRKARAVYAARIGQVKDARQDLAIINAGQKGESAGTSIETQILLAEGRARDAYTLNMETTPQEPGDWLVRAAVFDAVADDPTTTLADRTMLKQQASEIRARYGQEPDYD